MVSEVNRISFRDRNRKPAHCEVRQEISFQLPMLLLPLTQTLGSGAGDAWPGTIAAAAGPVYATGLVRRDQKGIM